ncbi:TonB-dependent receptor [Sphingomonas sp. CJ20]
MQTSRFRSLYLGATALGLLASVPAWAGDRAPANAPTDDRAAGAPAAADPTVDDKDVGPELQDSSDILVTARRREERLQDVPVAITAVSGDTLGAQHIYRVADFAAKLPNFAAVQQNTRVSGLYIRGLGGNANNDGAESGVGLIVDNVFFTHVGFSWLDFVDLDHIELVRGPQGTLLGKNTTIGALVVTTKRPSFTPELNLEAGYGNQNRFQIRANATGPVIGDTLAYRATFYVDRSDGWAKNAYDGQKYLDVNRWAARGQLLFQSGPVTSRLIAEHYETSEYNNYYPGFTDATRFANGTVRAGAWQNKLQSIFGYTPSYDVGNNADLNTQNRISSKVNGVSNELTVDLGGPTLTAVTAWRQQRFRPKNDSDASPLSILRAGYDVDVDQYSQEIRLASATGGTLDWQFGGYFLREDLISNNRSIFQSDSTKYFLTGALPAAFLLPSILDGVEYDQKGQLQVTSGAAFGQATLHATDRLALTGGLRFTRENKKASNTATSFGGATLPAALAPARAAIVTAFGGLFRVSDERTTDSWSWLVNPSFKLSDDVLLYASVSYGEKSGAANLGATPNKPVIIDPEKSTDYEAGIKTTLAGGRATLNLNFYWNDIKDFQATQLDPTRVALGNFLGNAGRVRLRGVELEGAARLGGGFSLSANGAYNDATFRSYKNAPVPIEYSYTGGPTSIDLSGTRVPGASKWTGQVSLDYDAPVSDRINLTGYVNQTYRSETNLLSAISTYGHQDGYGLTNAGIGIRSSDGRYSLQFWGRNVFDKRYAVGLGPASAVSPFIKVLGDPRTFGATLRGRF